MKQNKFCVKGKRYITPLLVGVNNKSELYFKIFSLS